MLEAGGAPALVLIMALENVFPPIPSEVVLPLAGSLVARGRLGLVPALLAATLGSVLGAVVLYELGRHGGRHGGRHAVEKLHPLLRMDREDLDRADAWFDRRGGLVVLLGRMLPFLRSVVSLPAGWSEMPRGRFLLLTAIGSGLWNALLLGGGAALGRDYEAVSRADRYGTWVVVLLVVALVAGRVRRHRRRAG